MTKKKIMQKLLSDDEIRQIMLEYFYNRNKNATSRRGKKTGVSATISIIRTDLKSSHGLKNQEVQRNLTYLLSQGWVEDEPITKNVPTKTGNVIPSTTNYYLITAAGIDKISGPSEFTRDRFQGIKIEATGQNIITLGDGNRIDAKFQHIGEELSELRELIKSSDQISDNDKLDLVVDINSLQDQLGRSNPNKTVIRSLWDGISKLASVASLSESILTLSPMIASLLD